MLLFSANEGRTSVAEKLLLGPILLTVPIVRCGIIAGRRSLSAKHFELRAALEHLRPGPNQLPCSGVETVGAFLRVRCQLRWQLSKKDVAVSRNELVVDLGRR